MCYLWQTEFKDIVINQMTELENFKTVVGEVVDTLDEEYYLNDQGKSFVNDFEVSWEDRLSTSQQQLQALKGGK